ncbi:MAG: hypothetical protein AAFQ84_12230 [Pseudomonadota bacterium]
MSFREKTAWVMTALLTLAGGFYAWEVIGAALALNAAPPPSIKLALVYLTIVIIGAIVGNATLALNNPEDADAPADERERQIIDKAGHWSGYVVAIGAAWGAVHYWAQQDADFMFHAVVAGLMLSQIADYVFQIVLYRRGV